MNSKQLTEVYDIAKSRRDYLTMFEVVKLATEYNTKLKIKGS